MSAQSLTFARTSTSQERARRAQEQEYSRFSINLVLFALETYLAVSHRRAGRFLTSRSSGSVFRLVWCELAEHAGDSNAK